MKKTMKTTALILGGLALALTITLMSTNEDGQPGWGTNSTETRINL